MKRAQFMNWARNTAWYGKNAWLKAAMAVRRHLGVAQTEEKYRVKSLLDAANLVMMEMIFLLPG